LYISKLFKNNYNKLIIKVVYMTCMLYINYLVMNTYYSLI